MNASCCWVFYHRPQLQKAMSFCSLFCRFDRRDPEKIYRPPRGPSSQTREGRRMLLLVQCDGPVGRKQCASQGPKNALETQVHCHEEGCLWSSFVGFCALRRSARITVSFVDARVWVTG